MGRLRRYLNSPEKNFLVKNGLAYFVLALVAASINFPTLAPGQLAMTGPKYANVSDAR